jgi:hypothetical protein
MTPAAAMSVGVAAYEVAIALAGWRFLHADEDALQEGCQLVLQRAGYIADREVRLDARNRIDLRVVSEGVRVGIEVKIAGRRDAVLRQLTRYAESDQIDALILVTTCVRHSPMPVALNGKPLLTVALAGTSL